MHRPDRPLARVRGLLVPPHEALVRVRTYLRGAPATLVYTFTVVVTWYSVAGTDRPTARALLRSESTNLHNMITEPVRVLVSSAFWIESPAFPVLTTGGLLLVMVPAERALGTRRWVAVFAAGHVVASVLTVVGIAVGVYYGLLPARLSGATDVGVSYGAAAVTATALALVPRPGLRWCALGALGAVLAALAVVDHTFTDVGHLVAFGVGLACWPVVRRWRERSRARAQVGLEEAQDPSPGVLGAGMVVARPRDEAHH